MDIFIPTINDKPADFATLFRIWSQVNAHVDNVKFDFSHCNFLRPNAVAFLGGLARLVRSRNGRAWFDWATCTNGAVMTNLCQNGFAATFKHSRPGWGGQSIPYREDSSLNTDGVMDYLTHSWLGHGWVNVSSSLCDAIAGKMWEIYNNAFEHSGSKVGVFSCGQHFKSHNDLILSVVDFGRGIPTNVREFFHSRGVDQKLVETISDAACLEWAFGRGHSTCPQGVARGLGLDLLKEFVQLNNGKLEVYSNAGYAIVNKDGERFQNLDSSFEGTIVHITLRCDEKLYHLTNETESRF